MQRNSNNIMESGQPYLPFLDDFDNRVKDTDISQFLSEHKAMMRFPETLLFLLVQAEREAFKAGCTTKKSCIEWTRDGRAFVIRNKEELIHKLLPLVFSTTAKFSSFTRKLYRWGFRQVKDKKKCQNGELTFWHPNFQRENKSLIVNMKSTTAEGTRRALENKTLMSMQPAELTTGKCGVNGRESHSLTAQCLAHVTPTSTGDVLSVPDNSALPFLEPRTIANPTQSHNCLEQSQHHLSIGPWMPAFSYPPQRSHALTTSELVNQLQTTTKQHPSSEIEKGRYLVNASFQSNFLTAGNNLLEQIGSQGEAMLQTTFGGLELFVTENELLNSMNRPFRSYK